MKPATLPLRDLEGRPGITVAVFANSMGGAINAARSGKAATSAGRFGAIKIWRDLDGYLHTEFLLCGVRQDHKLATIAGLVRMAENVVAENARGAQCLTPS